MEPSPCTLMYSALLTLILCSICRNLDMSSWSVLHVSLFSYLYVPSGLASKSMNPGERKRRAFAHSALKSAAGFASRPSVYLRQGDAYRFSSSVRKRAHVNEANLNVQHTQSQSFPSLMSSISSGLYPALGARSALSLGLAGPCSGIDTGDERASSG